jgi:hemerythrin-like domain-containing protein/SAM-dependent methyltransferase
VQGHRLQKWPHADLAGRQKIVDDFVHFWDQEAQRHFCEEEQALLPYFARWGDLQAEPIQQMLREHVLIRRDAQLIKENAECTEEFFIAAGKLLEGHVRLEERVVFPLIEASLPEHALDALPATLIAWQQTSMSHQIQEEKTMSKEESTATINAAPSDLPGATLQAKKMPGHWLLARLGKKVLRPGGVELTRQMLDELKITSADDVIEFAPGLGATAELTLEYKPRSYTAVERDEAAATRLCNRLKYAHYKFKQGTAEDNGLPDAIATVVYGEAMLTMQPANTKTRIVQEAARLLKPGGRYAIHELSLLPDDMDDALATEIANALAGSIHVGARPLRVREWRALLEDAGFEIIAEHRAPMHLLEPKRLIADEGASGTAQILWNIINDEEALSRIREMRSVFQKYEDHIGAVSLVGRKK